MEDHKPTNPEATETDGSLPRPGGGQVMDIKSSFNSGDSAPILTETNTDEAAPSSSDVSSDTVTEAPVVDESNSMSAEEPSFVPPEEVASSPETLSEPPQDAPVEAAVSPSAGTETSPSEPFVAPVSDTSPSATSDNPLAIPPQVPKKSGKPTMVIVIAIIVALGLAGLVVFTFMKTKKDTVGTNKTSNSTSTQTATKPLASPADVDTTNAAIESSLNKVNDTTDFSTTSLSDKSLGL